MPERPRRIVAAEHLPEHAPEARIHRADHRAREPALADEPRTAGAVAEIVGLHAQVRQRLALRQRDGRIADLDLGARTLEIGALAERAADGGIDVRRRPDDRHAVGGLEPNEPVVGALGIDDERAERVLDLERHRPGDDQVLLTLRDLGPRGDEVERRRLADVHARPVVALELERQVERPLLDVDERQRGDESPVAAFGVGARVHAGLAEAAPEQFPRCAGSRRAARAPDRS